VFADTPLRGGQQLGNVVDTRANAANYLVQPAGAIGALDMTPKAGKLTGSSLISAQTAGFADSVLDFDSRRYDDRYRGAYSIEGVNDGWRLALERKPRRERDGDAPAPPTSLTVN
jgi:hypothetical protein